MTKPEIIDAAFRVWGREFYLNTSLSQLAGELKVSKPALYRHFKNKQALLDAMTACFFDDICAFVRTKLEANPDGEDCEKNALNLIRAVSEYYGKNINSFLFALVQVYGLHKGLDAEKEIKSRGVDILHHLIIKDTVFRPLLMRMLFSTITFFMADFHRKNRTLTNPPAEEAVFTQIEAIIAIIQSGCGYDYEDIAALDYQKLENCIKKNTNNLKDDPLLKAVAGAIAEASPWKASMDQVARRLGLSKSSLYGHFKNKQDMLRRFFEAEFVKIIEFVRQGMEQSELPVERFYLGVFSIAVYLRLKPEILAALDSVRTRKVDRNMIASYKTRGQETGADNGPPPEFFRIFEDAGIKAPQGGESGDSRHTVHWMLFLVIGILMGRPCQTDEKRTMPDGDIRVLFRFITLGIRGFQS